MKNIFVLLFVLCCIPSVFGAEAPAAIYIIFDASGSMWQKLPDGAYRIDAAKSVLQEFVERDFGGYDLAFRVYGHRRKSDCRDSELVIPFAAPATVIPEMQKFAQAVDPKGMTPIHYSLQEALNDFGNRSGEIILISDGEETCDEDPCALVGEWKKKNVTIKVHVVGLGLDEKSKAAMECIARAAGTRYYDAGSSADLAESLRQIQEQAVFSGFRLEGADEKGEAISVKGTLSQGGKERYKVGNVRQKVDAGEYTLIAGVETRNGTLYKPVTKTVSVSEKGETLIRIQIARPPSVRAKFVEEGEIARGAQIFAYQNGKEIFSFRWIDEVFLDEGTYEFRTAPDRDNALTVTESFAAGERKEILFRRIKTVLVKFKMVASGSGIWFRENYELRQGNAMKYNVHMVNGAQVLPGTYDLHLPNPLTPYVKENVVITDQEDQVMEVTVPAGHVTVVYQKADGSPDKDDRCFLGRGPDGSGVFRKSGEKYPLVPGTYNVAGWSQKGSYDPVVFEIAEGEEKVIVLRAK